MEQNMEIANTIWNQMKTLDANLILCMGVQKLVAIQNGLQFKVNGLAFKGLVQITLNHKDLYDIKFLTPRAKKVTKEYSDVFFDQMMPLLDRVVERGDEVSEIAVKVGV